MMARALPGILPPLTPDESLEVTRIYSSIGAVPRGAGLIRERPFRAPHHSASAAAIVGGGSSPRAGEVSLAHHGVLFLDELPEFPRVVLESMREPLEDGFVTISRANGTVRFPARTMLVAAMNPTHAGGFAESATETRAQEKYIGRLSGPLLDRIDMHIEVRAVPFASLRSSRSGLGSADLRGLVLEARGRMEARQGRSKPNARLGGRELDRWCALEGPAQRLLESAMTDLGLSARAYDRVRRVARTIADLDGSEGVSDSQLAEAIHYRVLDRIRKGTAR
jgi:magnesium chelatase family protein